MSERANVMGDTPSDLRHALLSGCPLIDVRAPVEFESGHAPGAVNAPVLDNAQREAVGIAYKQQGPEAAIELGRSLLSGDDRHRKMQAWLELAALRDDAVIYCFRGGLRSQSVAEALREAGSAREALKGGYKRIRRFLLESIDRIAVSESFAVVGGRTGSAKTQLITRLSSRTRTLDLEGLARHRGSAFGAWSAPQPSLADFENSLSVALWRQHEREIGGPIVVEDESRLVGRLTIPQSVFNATSTAPVYVVEADRRVRARFLATSYLSETYGLIEGQAPDETVLLRARDESTRSLEALRKRLGGAETQAILTLLSSAFTEHARSGSMAAHEEWIERLLAAYYDPVYDRHLTANASRVVFRGSAADVEAALIDAATHGRR